MSQTNDKKGTGKKGTDNKKGTNAEGAAKTGAQVSVAQAGKAAPAVSAEASKGAPAGVRVVNLKRMPGMKGQSRKGGNRGSNGVKRLLYALFAIPYGEWTNWAKFVANGQQKNVFAEGAEHTAENRLWELINEQTGVPTKSNITNAEAQEMLTKEGGIPAGNMLMPMYVTDKGIVAITSHVKNHELADHFAKAAATESDAERKEGLEIAAAHYGHEDQPKYHGFVCCSKENIEKVKANVRGFFALNPESENGFLELENYPAIFGQAEAEIANAEWETFKPADAAEAETETEEETAAEVTA